LPPIAQQKISQLEREMHFLKSQHSDTLCKLHEEIGRIKKKNKDLMYQLAMGGSGPAPGGVVNTSWKPAAPGSKTPVGPPLTARVPKLSMDESRKFPMLRRTPKLSMDESRRLPRGVAGEESGMLSDELQTIMLEEEIKDLKNALNNEKKKNARLMNVIEQRRPRSIDQSDAESIVSAHSPVGPEKVLGRKPVAVSHSPSVEQYKSIIKHLQKTNDSMAHELIRLKSDLRDVLFSEKLTPESFLIAKAYVKRDGDNDVPGDSGLPKFHSEQHHYGQRPDMLNEACRTINEGPTLPPLKPKLHSNLAERRRKTEAIQKSRVGKSHLR
jgi:hypothetical protein